MFIYKTANTVNNKIYIGLDTGHDDEMRRWKSHQKGFHFYKGQSKLFNSMKKYGVEKFKCEIIDKAESAKELRDKEEFWIAKFNTCKNGLNILPSANGGKLGNKVKWESTNPEEIEQSRKHAQSLHSYFGDGEKSKIVKENWRNLSEEERFQKSNGLRVFWKNLNDEEKSRRGLIGSKKALETNAKRYFVYDPIGNEYYVIGLGLFCKENNLGEKASYYLNRVAQGYLNDFDGWKCIEIDKNTGEKIIPKTRIKQKPGPKKKI